MNIKTGPPTMRCALCNLNWPYATEFRRCHKCGHTTTAMKLADPDEEALTWREALALVAEGAEGAEPAPRAQTRRAGREPTERELAELHAGMDYWAEATGPDDPALG